MRIKWRQIQRYCFVANVKGYQQVIQWINNTWDVAYRGPFGRGFFAAPSIQEAERKLKSNLTYTFKRVFYTPIGCLKLHTVELRNYDSINLSRLTKSIKKRGIRKPLMVACEGKDYDLVILDGVCRYLVAARLGLKTVPVTFDMIGD